MTYEMKDKQLTSLKKVLILYDPLAQIGVPENNIYTTYNGI